MSDRKLRVLASAFDYRPRRGGIATCAYELCRAMSALPGVDLRLLAPSARGDAEFDRHGAFETARVRLPATAFAAIPALTARTAAQLQIFRPDAILDFLWVPSSVASWLLTPQRSLTKTPYFVLAHAMELLESDRDLRRRLRGRLSFLKRRALRGAEEVFAVSHFTGELLRERCGVAPDRIRVVRNGVDAGRFSPGAKSPELERRYGLEGKTVFLTITRLDDFKGVDRAIASLSRVARDYPDFIYLICGEGPDLPRLRAITRHYRMEGRVRFAGAVEEARLVEHYRLGDCLLLLSREDWEAPNVEGFGLVFLEAAACGLPAIGGRSGGIPDAVVDGVTGWLVDPTDDGAIARALIECLGRPEERDARGARARERALREMGWDRMAETIVTEVSRKCAASAASS